MIEYMVLAGGAFGLGSASITQMLTLTLAGLALVGVGFAIKGAWGAIVALSLGTAGYLYWNHLLPF